MFLYRVIWDASFKKWSSTGPRPTLRVKIFKFKLARKTNLVNFWTYSKLLRYPATSEKNCGNACGSVAGCSGSEVAVCWDLEIHEEFPIPRY